MDVIARRPNQSIRGVGCAPVGSLEIIVRRRLMGAGEKGRQTYAQIIKTVKVKQCCQSSLLTSDQVKREVKKKHCCYPTFFDMNFPLHPQSRVRTKEETQSRNDHTGRRHSPGKAISVGGIVEVGRNTRWWCEGRGREQRFERCGRHGADNEREDN